MGYLLPGFKKALIDDFFASPASYYAFAANPVAYTGNTPPTATDDYSALYYNDWSMLFGKYIDNPNLRAAIPNNIWVANTVYTMYNNTVANLTNYYVVTNPSVPGGAYNVFKCINNANGAPSTVIPDQIQPQSFTKSDGYTWRYITSVSASDYTNFAANNYIPIVANSVIVSGAYNYSGIEVCMITNAGSGYNAWNNGIVRSVVNTTVIQIDPAASTDNNFYTKNGIYIYNTSAATSQLKVVSQYVSNSSGNWIYLDSPANTTNITPSVTQYRISPRVVFDTDGDADPQAYTVVGVGNSIANVVMIDNGYGISRANVSIVSNTAYGVGANLYAIVPPAGGHGSEPDSELNVQGLAISISFSGTETSTIPVGINYNKIGILKDPYAINTDGTKSANLYTNTTFSQVLVANVSPATTFTVGDYVTGQTTSSHGIVAFSNGSVIYLTGDKSFANNETIVSSDGLKSAAISINTLGSIYTKDLKPIYIQNISNVARSNTQTESFKLIFHV